MKNLRLPLLFLCFIFLGCNIEPLPETIEESISEETPEDMSEGISEVTPEAAEYNYRYTSYDDGEIESFQNIEESFIAFTREIAGNVNDRYIEVYFQTKDDVECRVWQNYNDGSSKELVSGRIPGRSFGTPSLSTIRGFDIRDFRRLYIRLNRTNGWLDIEFYKNGNRIWSLPYFRRPNYPNNSIAFVTSTYTEEAYYVGLGGRSQYENNADQPGTFTRADDYPNNFNIRRDLTNCQNAVIADKFSLKYLSENNIAFDHIDDKAMTSWDHIKRYETLVFGQHNEYWTPDTFRNIKRFVDQGGNLLFLGGNSAYRVFKQKRYYKVLSQSVTRGAEFEIVRNYLGSFYTAEGYLTFAPYKKLANHPLMNGVGDAFGLTSLNNCNNTSLNGIGDGASGWETDKKINDTFITLAKGANPNSSGAEIVYKEFRSGGKVLNFGSMALTGSFDDEGIDRMMQNIFDEFEMR